MLTVEQRKFIAKTLRIPENDFEAALKDDKEVTLTIPENLTVLDETELKRVKDAEYDNGKTKGVEMAVKDVKEKLNLDTQGKTIEGLITAATKKALDDAKIEPDKKVTALEKDAETLRTQITTLTTQLQAKDKETSVAMVDREIFKALPSLGDNAADVDTVVSIMRTKGIDFKIDNGQLVAVKGDDVIKDNVAKVIPVKDVITTFAKENKLMFEAPGGGGRGGGDPKHKVVFTKLSELQKHYESQGKSANGQEFQAEAQKIKKENPEFDLNA